MSRHIFDYLVIFLVSSVSTIFVVRMSFYLRMSQFYIASTDFLERGRDLYKFLSFILVALGILTVVLQIHHRVLIASGMALVALFCVIASLVCEHDLKLGNIKLENVSIFQFYDILVAYWPEVKIQYFDNDEMSRFELFGEVFVVRSEVVKYIGKNELPTRIKTIVKLQTPQPNSLVASKMLREKLIEAFQKQVDSNCFRLDFRASRNFHKRGLFVFYFSAAVLGSYITKLLVFSL